MRFVPHARVAQDRLGDVDRHHHQRRRDDDHAGAMRFLHHIVEMLDEIGIDRLRGHEHQRDVLRLARQKIALGDVLDVLHDVGAHAGLRGFARLLVARRAQGRKSLERKFGVNGEQARIARQADDAVGAGAVREGELEVVRARGQAVANDRLHAALTEGAARLLVGENVLQRHHFPRHFSEPRLRRVDDREALIEPAETLARRLRLTFEPRAEPRPDQSSRSATTRARSAWRDPSHSAMPATRPLSSALDLASSAKRSSIASCRSSAASRSRRRAAPARQSAISVRNASAASRANAAASAWGRKIGTPSMTAIGEAGIMKRLADKSKWNKIRTCLTAPVQAIISPGAPS